MCCISGGEKNKKKPESTASSTVQLGLKHHETVATSGRQVEGSLNEKKSLIWALKAFEAALCCFSNDLASA